MQNLGELRFGPFLPDQPDYQNVGTEEARNVLPLTNGYASLRSFQRYSNTIPGRCMGAVAVRDSTETVANYCGDETDLYKLSGLDWVSAATGLQANEFWDFAQFGDVLIAAAYESNLQSLTIPGATFAELVAIRAYTVETVRNFVVIGNTFDATDGAQPFRLRWCARGDHTDWTPSASTLAGFQSIPAHGGPVRRIVGREYGLVFQERAISRMTYTAQVIGSTPVVWQVDEIERGIGTPSPRSVVEFAGMTAFFAEDGFRMLREGSRSTPIDDDTVSRTVLADINSAYLDRITGAVDVNSQTIYWAYPSSGATQGRPNRLVLYRYGINRWAFADDELEHLYESATPAVDIDTDLGPDDVSAEAAGSLDDDVWKGGGFQLGIILGAGELSFLDGPPRSGVLTTGESAPSGRQKTFVRAVRPLVDLGAGATIQIGYRDRLSDSVVWTDPVPVSDDGSHKFRVRARYLRARVITADDFRDAVGVQAEGRRAAGVR